MRGARGTWIVLVLGLGLGGVLAAQTQTASALTADELFKIDKVWTVHLTLPNDSFSALMPVPAAPTGPTAMAQALTALQQQPDLPSVLPPDVFKRLLGGAFVGPVGGRNGISANRGLDFAYLHASLDFEGIHFDDVAVRPKGNGTYGPVINAKVPKPPLKIDLNKFVKGQKLAGVSTLNLHNSIFDPSWMNEALAFRLYRDAGVPAPRTAYARVYVTAKNEAPRRYLGLYTLVENVDEDFTESRFKVSGGALFKPVTIAPFTFIGRDWADYNQMYDPKDDLTAADQQRVFDFSDLVTNADDQQFAARLADFVDLEAFARYMAVLVWMANPDSLLTQGQNYYVFLHPSTRKFLFVPWDQDHSFGQFVPFMPAEYQQQLDVMRPWRGRFEALPFAAQVENRLLTRTFRVEAFKRLYLSELARISRDITPPERLAAQVDALVPLIKPLVAEEPKDGRVIAFDAAVTHGTFTRPFNQNSGDVNPIKVFLPIRQASVIGQLKTLGQER